MKPGPKSITMRANASRAAAAAAAAMANKAKVAAAAATTSKVTLILILLSAIAIDETHSKLNSVLNINETFPYLLDRQTGQVIEPRDYMDFDNLYSPNATYKAKQTAQGRNYYMLKAFDFANYYQSDYWRYSSEDDLRLSAYPVASERLCSEQLDWLERQLNDSARSLFGPGQEHINLAAYVDSFGRPEATTYFGHAYWLGSHFECTRVSIDMNRFEDESAAAATANGGDRRRPTTVASSSGQRQLKTRYCVGKARDIDWPEDDNYVPRISYKVGLCLPESCETLSLARHRAQLERLMRFNMPDYMRRRIYLDDLYCLPDRRSPIRAFSLSAKIYLGLCSVWLIALVAATFLYSCIKRHQRDLRTLTQQMRAVELSPPAALNAANSTNGASAALKSDDTRANLLQVSPMAPAAAQSNNNNNNSAALLNNSHGPTKQANGGGGQSTYLVNYMAHASKHLESMSKSAPASPSLLIIRQQQQQQPGSIHMNVEDGSTTMSRRSGEGRRANRDHDHDDDHDDDYEQDADSYSSDSADGGRSELSYESSASSTLSGWLKQSPLIVRLLQALSITENVREFQLAPRILRNQRACDAMRVNLNSLDAIKCFCCILVIFGHIVFIHMQHQTNIVHTIEQSEMAAPRALIAVFNFVDTFFIISGMLTAYFIFKRFNKRSFANPLIWLYIVLLRLIRLSPVYLLVFWFVKTVSVHLADGPIWDYGTDRNSIKGLCIHDHWWKSLLYLGNVGTMQPLCILPAWSIIVDAQYSLILPPIMYLIFKHRRVGYATLVIAILVSTANMSYQLASQTAVKTADMAKIRLHVYPLISRFAAEFYNAAWNRVGPVAIGIMGGRMLYLYDIGKIRRWPFYMRGAAFKLVLALHLFIFVIPTISSYTDGGSGAEQQQSTDSSSGSGSSKAADPGMTALFVLSNATIKPIWSIINTIFLLRLITDLRKHSVLARLMSHNIWHCLGKLSFASYLIHYEIILILLKSRQEGLMEPNWWNVAREFSVAFLISTAIAYLIYVLFEAPVNKLIMLNVDKDRLTKEKPQRPHSSVNSQQLPTDDHDQDRLNFSGDRPANDISNNRKHLAESFISADDHDTLQSAPIKIGQQNHYHFRVNHQPTSPN